MKEFDLEPGESVVRQTRKHWFLFAIGLLPFAILGVLPFALPKFLYLAPQTATYAATIRYTDPLMRAGFGLWLLLVWTAAWGNFTRYYLNVWVLTTNRIVAIKQRGFFSREVSSILLNRVQDVTSDVHGVLPSLLGIGNITVQSAGAENEFHMRDIPLPEEMRDLILKHIPEEHPKSGV